METQTKDALLDTDPVTEKINKEINKLTGSYRIENKEDLLVMKNRDEIFNHLTKNVNPCIIFNSSVDLEDLIYIHDSLHQLARRPISSNFEKIEFQGVIGNLIVYISHPIGDLTLREMTTGWRLRGVDKSEKKDDKTIHIYWLQYHTILDFRAYTIGFKELNKKVTSLLKVKYMVNADVMESGMIKFKTLDLDEVPDQHFYYRGFDSYNRY